MTSDNGLRFSVVIPAYNAADTINRAVGSVLAQSYRNFEIIIVDDASTDDTYNIAQAIYAEDITITVVKKVTNTGASGTRNAGMNIAKGDYIAFLDADDTWHSDKLMLINAILSATQGITLLYHPYTFEDIRQKKIPEDIKIFRLPFVKLLPANVIAPSCAIIRNNPEFRFDDDMRHCEDYDLWLQVGYKHKIHFISIPLTQLFRPFLSEGGTSSNRWAMRRGEMRAYRHLTRLNPLFMLLLPMLILSSLGKHLVKMAVK